METRIGKKDIVFLAVVLAVIIFTYFIFTGTLKKQGSLVQVKVDGEVYGTYSLDEDRTVEIKDGSEVINTLCIENGYADMIDATCPDKLCVKQNKINKEKQTIVCLPHKLVVEVISSDEEGFDSVSK